MRKEENKAPLFITNDHRNTMGSHESCRVYTITSVNDGKTEAVIDVKISKRVPVQKLKKLLDMHEVLTGGGGRRIIRVEDLLAITKHQLDLSSVEYEDR